MLAMSGALNESVPDSGRSTTVWLYAGNLTACRRWTIYVYGSVIRREWTCVPEGGGDVEVGIMHLSKGVAFIVISAHMSSRIKIL